MESAIEGLFNVMLEWIPKYYTFEKMYHTVGKHGEPNTLFFNPESYRKYSDYNCYNFKSICPNLKG